jgi:hypothetical protein
MQIEANHSISAQENAQVQTRRQDETASDNKAIEQKTDQENIQKVEDQNRAAQQSAAAFTGLGANLNFSA